MKEYARDYTISISGSPLIPPPIQFAASGSRSAAQFEVDKWHMEEQREEEQGEVEDRRERALREIEKRHGSKAAQALRDRAKVDTDKEVIDGGRVSGPSLRKYKRAYQEILTELSDKEN